MAIELAFTEIRSLFTGTSLFGLDWVMLVLVTGLSLIMISNQVQTWKHLAFPVIVGWYTAGLKGWSMFDAMILVIAGVSFVIETLSIETASKVLETVREKTLDVTTRMTQETREIIKESRKEARQKAYKNILDRTASQQLRQDTLKKDILKSAGAIKGMGLLQGKRRKELTKKAIRDLQKETSLERLRTKAEMGSTKHRIDMARGRVALAQLSETEVLMDRHKKGLLTSEQLNKLLSKRGIMRGKLNRLDILNKLKKMKEEAKTNEEKKELEKKIRAILNKSN